MASSRCISHQPALEAFLSQDMGERCGLQQGYDELAELLEAPDRLAEPLPDETVGVAS